MATLNYIFNLCIIIGFVIPLLNVLSGWLGSLFGSGADMDFDASADAGVDIPSDISIDIPMDISIDVPTDFSIDIPMDVSIDVPTDFNIDIPMDVSVDIPADIGVGGGAADVSAGAGTGASAASGGIIPFNMMCLCLFLVVFGALGQMTKGFMTAPLFMGLLLFGCFAVACLSYWALFKLVILRLRRNDASALSYNDLRGKSAEVTLRIRADSIGTISLRDSTGAPISFRAKMDPDLKDKMDGSIPQGETVIITDVDLANMVCFVSVPFSKFPTKEN